MEENDVINTATNVEDANNSSSTQNDGEKKGFFKKMKDFIDDIDK